MRPLALVAVVLACAGVCFGSSGAGAYSLPGTLGNGTVVTLFNSSLCFLEATVSSPGIEDYVVRTDMIPLTGDFLVYSPEPSDPPGYQYQVSMCKPFPEWSQCSGASLDRPAAVIQRRPPSSTTVLCKNCGSYGQNSTSEYINGDPYQGVRVTYRNGQAYHHINADRKSVIDVHCDPSVKPGSAELQFLGENKLLGTYFFSLNSSLSCPQEIFPEHPDNGGGGNSNLGLYLGIGLGVGGAVILALVVVVILLVRKNRKLFQTFKEREAKEMVSVKNPYAQVTDV